jgi:hypothetical protein
MKYCPKCNFSFPDFHRVCDFDGTELVSDPERQALVKASPRPSRIWRILMSPTLLTSLAMMALFLGPALVSYHRSTSEIPPVVKDSNERPPLSVVRISTPSPVLSKRSSARNINTLRASNAGPRRQTTSSRSVARLHQRAPALKQAQKSEFVRRTQTTEIVRRRGGQEFSGEKDPKFIAILKTTWSVMKKPFRF